MAIQSQPSRISEPFAGSGTKNVIPATNATPSASQAASWASGFPPECSQPISAGGCPVPRNDMNGVLNWLSQGFAFQQDGGIWEWSALADYDTDRMVRGSDGKLYWSVAQSGPGIAAGAQDPTADNGTYWQAMPINDAGVVHTTGNETVAGVKTFSNHVVFKDFISVDVDDIADINLINLSTNIVNNTPPVGNTIAAINVFDQNNKSTAAIYNALYSARESLALQMWPDGVNNAMLYFTYWYGTQNFEFFPSSNGLMNLGNGSNKWATVYASTGTINTSDERLKSSISEVPDEVLDAWGAIGFVQYQFNDSLAKKGPEARLHNGLIAQRISEAFAKRGLDASRYGLFCYDEWEAEPEERDANGSVRAEARPAGDAYALRYEEALCMEAAFQRRRADRAEARLAALEERLAAIEAKLNAQP